MKHRSLKKVLAMLLAFSLVIGTMGARAEESLERRFSATDVVDELVLEQDDCFGGLIHRNDITGEEIFFETIEEFFEEAFAETNVSAFTSDSEVGEVQQFYSQNGTLIGGDAPSGDGADLGCTCNDEPVFQPHALLGSWFRVGTVSASSCLCIRSTVYIEVLNANGTVVHGKGFTGFMIGPSTVVTAAHGIHSGTSYYGTRIRVTPGRNGSGTTAPFGVAWATSRTVSAAWVNSGGTDAGHDWGIISLDRNIGDQTSWMGLRWTSSSLNRTNISVHGYPDRATVNPNFFMYKTNGTISASNARTLESRDTNTTHGMSGGPLYELLSNGQHRIHGIVQGSIGGNRNVFVRITEPVFNLFVQFRDIRV
jgi:V8-like Glu-specific endopeptidase